ncbi:MAG: metallophosphoesterase [Thermosphaera sp.]
MIIAATGDVHSPRFLELFAKSLGELNVKPDVFILLGDNVDKNSVEAFGHVIQLIRRNLQNVLVVSVFGNEEYRGFEEKYVSKYREVVWLNDESKFFELEGFRMCIVGTRGALEKPTPWQAKNIPGIAAYYRGLPEKIESLLRECKNFSASYTVLASHYGVTYSNLKGEDPAVYPYLASPRMSDVIKTGLVDLVLHAHAHNGVVERVLLNNVPIINASLPARRKIVTFEASTGRRSIMDWIRGPPK